MQRRSKRSPSKRVSKRSPSKRVSKRSPSKRVSKRSPSKRVSKRSKKNDNGKSEKKVLIELTDDEKNDLIENQLIQKFYLDCENDKEKISNCVSKNFNDDSDLDEIIKKCKYDCFLEKLNSLTSNKSSDKKRKSSDKSSDKKRKSSDKSSPKKRKLSATKLSKFKNWKKEAPIKMNTMAQGDCLFSSIYRSLILMDKYNDLVKLGDIQNLELINQDSVKEQILKNTTKPIDGEENFIINARKYLASLSYIDRMVNEFEDDPVILKRFLQTEFEFNSDYLKHYLEKKKRKRKIDIDTVINKMKDILQTPQTYAGAAEVEEFRDLLKKINLDTILAPINLKDLREKDFLAENSIILVNEGDNHFQYIYKTKN